MAIAGANVVKLPTGITGSGVKPLSESSIQISPDKESSALSNAFDSVGGFLSSTLGNIAGAYADREVTRINGIPDVDTTGDPNDQAGASAAIPATVGGIKTSYLIYGALGLAALAATIYLVRS